MMKVSFATLLVVLLCKVDHITSTIHDDRNPGFLFDNHPGLILSLPANMTNVKQTSTKVSSKMDCVFACVQASWCRSVNFKNTPEMDGHHICELIATDNHTNPKHLKQDERFTHFNIKNPCQRKPCLNKGKCIPHKNRLDYRCKCRKGYTGGKCQNDIDECNSGSHGCDSNAVCTNSPGSFTCRCNSGFTGNGKICNDINECSGSHGCHSNAVCINSPGSFSCRCNSGFTGNGKACNDINECSGSHGCHSNAVCINSPGSFTCQCKTGFTGNGKVCTDIDECAANKCDPNAACSNTAGSYRCTCNRGYCGNGKQCHQCAYRGLDSSVILSTHGNSNYYFQRLSSYLDPVLQNPSTSQWVRCWRAASDGWNTTTTFHPQCDGKGPTVTIVRVGSYVFGGYTDISWYNNCSWTTGSRQFLFSLYNVNGYNPVKLILNGQYNQYAIFGCSTQGPSFGGGHDLYISSHAPSNQYSHTYPYSYQTPPGCKYRVHCSFYTGSDPFAPNDIEVFYETAT